MIPEKLFLQHSPLHNDFSVSDVSETNFNNDVAYS